MFTYPPQAAFNRIVAKSKIYAFAKPSQRVKNLFVRQVEEIIWTYKLAPETVNLPARPQVTEIQIFQIKLKTPDLDEVVLQAIDKAISFPIFYHLSSTNGRRTMVAYKRPNDADPSKWVVDGYFATEWESEETDSPSIPLPIATDLAGLYEQMLRMLVPTPSRSGESLKDLIGRTNEIHAKEIAINKLKSRLQREKQFNRKVEINASIRQLQDHLETLSRTTPTFACPPSSLFSNHG